MRFELMYLPSHTYATCYLCGEDATGTACATSEDAICPDCIKRHESDPEYFNRTLAELAAKAEADAPVRAAELEASMKASAAEFRSLIGNIEAPSYAEWKDRADEDRRDIFSDHRCADYQVRVMLQEDGFSDEEIEKELAIHHERMTAAGCADLIG
jgi:hypothetical protein